ncbi:hypothetical protein G6011_01140 [Alternaria panax]|uniref:Uncharacterized protein n=1 Tax=Alternaria panax TaxID=48097 RepID=A0AAD4IK69_9PLEO|nr:hypothetical protein G6011_01140 [Alternaria panax]
MFVLCSFTLILIAVHNVFAINTSNVNTTDTVGFVKEDNQRDTISLLISCFATLGLCVYSAVHLNVPRKTEGTCKILLRELQWCVLGLFAPELILYTAWRQLASARQLCLEVEEAKTKNDDGARIHEKTTVVSEARGQHRHSPWTIAHGFYGTMGGFALDIDDTDSRNAVLFNGAKRLTLTAKGVALFAQCGHIPDVSLDDIKDKNKADGLAKLLVCIQAGWMIVQVISRTANGLPTTLLEVHVVAHVVCALIMYILWWHKPRQVASPTLLRGEWLPLIAYMYLASQMSGKVPKGMFAMFRVATPELEKLAYFKDKGTRPEHFDPGNHSERAHPHATGHLRVRPTTQHLEQEGETTMQDPETGASSELKRLAEEALLLYPILQIRFAPAREGDVPGSTYNIPYVTELVQAHAIDWPNNGLLRRTQSLIMGMVLWGASTAYGAIHVAAWNYFFPSQLEQLFWRLSSVWVTFCAAFWLVTNLLAHLFPFIDRIWVAYNKRSLGWLSTVLISLLCILCGH